MTNIQLTKNFSLYELLGVRNQDIQISDGVLYVGNGIHLDWNIVLQRLHRIAGCLQIQRDFYGRPVKSNSCFRTWLHHVKIYEEINADRKSKGLPPWPIPNSSEHLFANAVDYFIVGIPVPQIVEDFKLNNWHGGFKAYRTFIHLDFRMEQYRW